MASCRTAGMHKRQCGCRRSCTSGFKANLKDFPADTLEMHRLEAIHPDDFLVYQLDLEPITALAAFKAMRDRLRNPQLTVEEFIAMLRRNGLANTALRLLEARALL